MTSRAEQPAGRPAEGARADGFDPGEPYAIRDLSRVLQRLTRDGSALLSAQPASVFFAPQGDRWSPAEQILHLTKSSRPLVRVYRLPFWVTRLMFGTATKPSRTFVALRTAYREKLAAGVTAGRFSPTPEKAPKDPTQRRSEILGEWQRTNEALTAAWETWRGLQLDQGVIPHPALGKLTAREMAIFTVYHTSHHLTQIATRLA